MGLKTWLGLKKPPEGRPDFVDAFGARNSFAQLYQDLWALSETEGRRGGYFVEIGAFDGVTFSNTYLLERKYGWSGLLAEPNPLLEKRIRASRRVPLCTRPVDGVTGREVTMLFVPTMPELSGMVEHAFNDHLAAHRSGGLPTVQRTISLTDMLDEFEAPNYIDFMSIDTEGSEPDILSALDFDRYQVNLFAIEHNNTVSEEKLEQLLIPKGYERVHRAWSQWDAWYRKK